MVLVLNRPALCVLWALDEPQVMWKQVGNREENSRSCRPRGIPKILQVGGVVEDAIQKGNNLSVEGEPVGWAGWRGGGLRPVL